MVGLLKNLRVDLLERYPQTVFNPLFVYLKDALIFGSDDARPYCIVPTINVLEGLFLGVGHDSEAGSKECFRCAHIPEFESRHKVYIIIGLLLRQVHKLIPGPSYLLDARWP